MDAARRKAFGKAFAAAVGHEFHGAASVLQRFRKRLRRKEMTAGAARRDEDQGSFRHFNQAGLAAASGIGGFHKSDISARGLRRVTAIRKPSATPSEMRDEPP